MGEWQLRPDHDGPAVESDCSHVAERVNGGRKLRALIAAGLHEGTEERPYAHESNK